MPMFKTYTVTVPVTYKIKSDELSRSGETTMADALEEALERVENGDTKGRTLGSAEVTQKS